MSGPDHDIEEAIRRSAQYVRQHSNISVWDTVRLPTPEEEKQRQSQIETVCDEMDELAARSATEDTRYPDYEELRLKLTRLGTYPLNEDVGAIARAFHAAGRLDRSPQLAGMRQSEP